MTRGLLNKGVKMLFPPIIAQRIGLRTEKHNYLFMRVMTPNVWGTIGLAVAIGILLSISF